MPIQLGSSLSAPMNGESRGFTYACGTGSGATAYAVARRREQTQANLVLHVLGGELRVEVASEELQLIGDAIFVSEGRILDENLFLD